VKWNPSLYAVAETMIIEMWGFEGIVLKTDTTKRGSCLQALRRGKCPNFAKVQGYWIGQLLPHLSNMAFGTLTLLRPIQSFGRMISYSSWWKSSVQVQLVEPEYWPSLLD
jgi:hypothetical protein